MLIDGFFRELVPAERKWQTGIWEVYQALAENGYDWTAGPVQDAISEHFQRSWACRKFGAEHACQFVPLCFAHQGYEQPLENGYVLRRPHHTPELERAVTSGVIPPDDAVEEEDE